MNASGQLDQRYVYGTSGHVPDYIVEFVPGTDTVEDTFRVVHDVRGSVRLVVSTTSGDVVQQYEYGPFGEMVFEETAAGFSQPFGYAGGLWDPVTGLVRFGARDYDPELGRWTAKDLIGFGGELTNLYDYVGGTPIDRVDPSGMMACNPVGDPFDISLEKAMCIYAMVTYTSGRDTSICESFEVTGDESWSEKMQELME